MEPPPTINPILLRRLEDQAAADGLSADAYLAHLLDTSTSPSGSEIPYRLIIENIQDSVTLQAVDGCFVYMNPALAQRLGLPRETVSKMTSADLAKRVHPDDLPHTYPVYERLLRGETIDPVDYRLRREDGTYVWVENRSVPLRAEDGRVEMILSTARDITDRKRVEQDLRRAESRARALLEAVADMMFRMSGDGVYLDYNADDLDLYDPTGSFIGKSVAEVMPEDLAKVTLDFIHEALATGTIQTYEYVLDLGERGVHDYEARMVPSGPNEVTVIVRDITDRKDAQARELALVLEKERYRLMTEFVQLAAHEFRTPLALIGTSAHLMVRSETQDRRIERAKVIRRQIDRITRLVDMLLQMIRLGNETPLERLPVSMQEISEVVCRDKRREYGNKPVLVCRYSPDLAPIIGDADCLRDALKQLIDNAFQHTPETGSIHLSMNAVGGHLHIVLVDTGSGIPQDALPHIFETFWRGDTAHTTAGFGLGLPLVQRIIERHGGSVKVESVVHQGTTVTLALPLV